ELRLQPLAQFAFDHARGAQQPDPQPQPILVGSERRRHRIHHASPPAIAIACPVTERAPSPHSHSTVSATSCGVMIRPCGLSLVTAARALSSSRPVLATILATVRSSIGVST